MHAEHTSHLFDHAGEVFRLRTDKKWGWRLRADNGRIIATDGTQGYEKESDARARITRVISGEFKDAAPYRAPLKER